MKVQIFETFECSGQNSPNSCHFWNNRSVFLQILRQCSGSWDMTVYFQQKESIKVQIWWNFTWAVESLKFCTLMGSFCPNHVHFQLKKYRRVISHATEERCKVWIKLDLVVSKLAWRIGWTFIKALKNLEICTLMGSFCPKRNVSARKFQRNYVWWHWKVIQNLSENWLVTENMT